MRSLLIALMVLIIVAAALLGWALYNIDTIITWNKDRIIAAAARRTGRTIDFDRVHVTFRGGIRVRILGLAVSEDPALGSGRFFDAPEVRVGLEIHPLRRQVTVTRVDTAGAVLHHRDGRRHLRLRDLKLEVDSDGDRATVRTLDFRLGQAQVSGNGVIESFNPLAIGYDLRSPQLQLADLQLQPDGVLEEAHASGRLTWTGSLAGGATLTASRGSLLGLDYTDLAATVDVARPWLVLDSLRLKALNGELEADGRMQLRDAPFPFEAALRVRGMDIGAYLDGTAGIPPARGTLEADLRMAGQGHTWDAVKSTLAGNGKAAVLGGRVLEFNLAEQALEGITGIQGLTELFSRGLRDRYPHIFQRGTTVLEQLDGEFKAEGGKVAIERITLKAKDYDVTGTGSVDLDGVTEIEGVLTVSQGLSADLVPPSRLRVLANGQGEIELPFSVDGTLPGVHVRPGPQLVARLRQIGVRARLGRLLDLFPGIKTRLVPEESAAESPETRKSPKDTPEAAEDKQEKPRATRQPEDPLQQLIDRGLRLFRGND
ncbi:MAG: AsmA-like C-terminal region-containing protein [Deltaproteobacteria bacterium]|nr:AsmA-like C-terminal region-containing protein [Deltaproteobacteria bacterium]